MTCEAPLNLTLFRPEGVIMLADVRTQVELMLAGNERRDTVSAFNVLAARTPVDLGATPATARSVRELFATVAAAALDVSAKRYANIRSLIGRAVDRFGMKGTRLTARVPLSPEWEALLQRVENATYRQGVKRLAHYCSGLGIPPEQVRSEHLVGLHDALEAECMTKHPRKVIKHTIAMWNHFGRTVAAWPATVLASPFVSEPDTLPLARFPESFRADVARWMERVGKPNPLDPEAPIRALKPATIKSYVVFFRRFGSALVRRNILALDSVTNLAVFFQGSNFKDRVFLRFTAAEMKTAAPLELELPADTIRLLDAFLLDHRGRIAGAAGPYLFPGPEGGARSYSAMRDAVSAPLREHAGIALSPHLYRHITAKIVAERAPELLTDLSRRLGHKSINTTYQAYLGTETPAASRRINRLLEATRAEPRLGSKS